MAIEVETKQDETEVQAEPIRVPLDTVVNRICRDSQNDPKSYLDETTVPHGGE